MREIGVTFACRGTSLLRSETSLGNCLAIGDQKYAPGYGSVAAIWAAIFGLLLHAMDAALATYNIIQVTSAFFTAAICWLNVQLAFLNGYCFANAGLASGNAFTCHAHTLFKLRFLGCRLISRLLFIGLGFFFSFRMASKAHFSIVFLLLWNG